MTTAFFASAKAPLARGEHLYRDVAAYSGIAWELLAALDWLQCKADPRRSPVHGEKLGAVNPDGMSYATKSNALGQCGCDLIELAAAVYGIDLASRGRLSVRQLAAPSPRSGGGRSCAGTVSRRWSSPTRWRA